MQAKILLNLLIPPTFANLIEIVSEWLKKSAT